MYMSQTQYYDAYEYDDKDYEDDNMEYDDALEGPSKKGKDDYSDKVYGDDDGPPRSSSDPSTTIYRMGDLMNSDVITKLPVNFDTHEPHQTQRINIYEIYLPTGDTKAFALDEDAEQEEAVKLIFVEHNPIILYLGTRKLTDADKRHLRDEELLEVKASTTFPYDLSSARDEIARLNNILGCDNFRITLDYTYTLDPNSTIYAYEFNTKDIVICLFERDVCVSSIMLYLQEDKGIADIASRTSETHEGNNLNKLLRAVSILVAPKIKPDLRYLISYAINPASVYLLVKYFDGEVVLLKRDRNAINEQTLFELMPQNHTQMTPTDAQNIIHEFVQANIHMHLDPDHLALAERVFIETAPKVRCERRNRRQGSLARGRTRRAKRNYKKTKRRGKGRKTKRRQRK